MEINLKPGKNLYFISDIHLGVPTHSLSLQREKLLVKWLDSKLPNAEAFFLLGDIFEIWFEYRTVVPKGFVRLLGKLAEITDSGVPVYFFTGNHDIWTFGYLQQEIGLRIMHDNTVLLCNGKSFYLGHGDGLGPGDNNYKFAKKVYYSKFLQKIFSSIHPDTGIKWISRFSDKHRYTNGTRKKNLIPAENDRLVIFCREYLEQRKINYFVFGHRHTPFDIALNSETRYINTGDWINHFSYACFDGEEMKLSSASLSILP